MPLYSLYINLYGHFFRENIPLVDLSAPTANINISKSDMHFTEASANFRLENRIVFLKTDDLQWDSTNQNFEGRGNVMINSNPVKVKGDFFSGSIPIKNMVVRQNSKAEIILPND